MRKRRAVFVGLLSVSIIFVVVYGAYIGGGEIVRNYSSEKIGRVGSDAMVALDALDVKGRAPKTGYSRDEFGGDWMKISGCSMRQIILYRDLTNISMKDECTVSSGTLQDPYTGEVVEYSSSSPSAVQIDHVVALSDAWQKGAQQLTPVEREALANDPMELIAADGPANQQKSDSDAASWLPPNKAFRCEYVARQIYVKTKYRLWVTSAEKDAMKRVLSKCPEQKLPSSS